MKVLEIILTLAGSAAVVKLLDLAYATFNKWREGKAKRQSDGATLFVETRKLSLDEVGIVITNLRDEVARQGTQIAALQKEADQRDGDYETLDQRYRALDDSYGELEGKYISLLRHVAEIDRKGAGKTATLSAETLLSELTGGGKRDDRRDDRPNDRAGEDST